MTLSVQPAIAIFDTDRAEACGVAPVGVADPTFFAPITKTQREAGGVRGVTVNDAGQMVDAAGIVRGVPVSAVTDPVTGKIAIRAGNQNALSSYSVPDAVQFVNFSPSLVPSCAASSTASRTGNVISVSGAHGLPALKYNGARVYFPGSPSIVAGWKTNFQRISSTEFTCVDGISGTVSSESVNSGAAMTDPVRVSGVILPAGSVGATDRMNAHAASFIGSTGATKSLFISLGGRKVMELVTGVPATASFYSAGSTSAQIGTGLSGAIELDADMTKEQRVDVYAQVSEAGDYVYVSSIGADIVRAHDQLTYSPSALPGITNASLVELAASTPRVINSRLNDGYVYGKHDSNTLYRSSDGARTWERIGAVGALGSDSIALLLPAGDGEVLLVGATKIYKTTGWAGAVGSVTRTAVLTSSTVAQFQTWGVDTDGAGRCVATHYAASPNFAASRYVWYSGDHGATWSVVRDLGGTSENDQHLHFAIFDKYASGRIYINHHQETDSGSGKAIEYSDDNGTTWAKVKHIQVLQSDGTVRSIQPTTAIVLPEGLVMGSDDPDTGLYILRRGENTAEYFAAGAVETGAPTTRSFATFAYIDKYNGIGYTCFKQQTINGCGYLMASNGLRGDVVFSDTIGFPVSGQSALGGLLPGFYAIASTPTEIVGTVVRPSASNPAANAYWLFRASKNS